MRNLILAVSATAMVLPATFVVPTDSAQARRQYAGYYDSNGYYHGPTWRGSNGRYYCRRGNGTTGLLIGGAGGALIGHELDGGRNHTTGTVIGAVAGALVGRQVQRSSQARRCR